MFRAVQINECRADSVVHSVHTKAGLGHTGKHTIRSQATTHTRGPSGPVSTGAV